MASCPWWLVGGYSRTGGWMMVWGGQDLDRMDSGHRQDAGREEKGTFYPELWLVITISPWTMSPDVSSSPAPLVVTPSTMSHGHWWLLAPGLLLSCSPSGEWWLLATGGCWGHGSCWFLVTIVRTPGLGWGMLGFVELVHDSPIPRVSTELAI